MDFVYIMMYLLALITLVLAIKNNAHRQVVRYF